MIDARQFTVQRGYHEEAKDGGDGGGGVVDRGDDLPQADVAADAVKAAADKAAAEAKVAADAKVAEDAKRAAEKAEREKGVQIPKERFDAAVAKERQRAEAAEKKAEAALAELATKATTVDVKKLEGELDTLEEALDKALAESDPAERKRLRGEIRAKTAQITDARVEARAAAGTAIAIEQIRYDAVVSSLETEYSFLNPDVETTFDVVLATEVMELKTAFEHAGMGSAAALKKAVGTLKHKLDAKKAPAKDEATAEAAKKAEEEKAAAAKKAEEVEEKRRADAVAAGLEAKKGTPPTGTGTVDKTLTDVKVGELSEEAFDKLPEAEKKRLRGD